MANIEKKKPKITLYEHINFKGRSITFTEANDNLIDQGFNDYSSSVIVEGGVWILYQHCDYLGNICVVMEGDRTNLVPCTGDKDTKIHDFNDRISSLKPWNFDFTEKPKCTVYAAANFKGRSLEFTDDILDLEWYKMTNQISSIRVHSGAWVGYDQPNFRGAAHSLFLTGDHSMSSTLGGFRNDRLRSLRALQIKETHPIITDNVEFHLNKGEHDPKLKNVFSWAQKNDTSVSQNLSISKVKTYTTENFYEIHWDAGASVSFDISAEVAAELKEDYSQVGTAKASKTYKLGMEAHASVGELRKRNTINTETWNVVYPTTIPPKTKITLTSSLTRSTMNVPYTVTFRQGKKKWTESGTYRGVDHHGFVTEFKEEPL